MSVRLVIGSRGSKLALIQAKAVAEQLKLVEAGLNIEIRTIVTEGDRNQSMKIEDTGSTGVFVRALEDALLSEEIDLAVHSLKDLPVVQPAGLSIMAVTMREDSRDALVASSALADLRRGARIGTSSIRRAVQIRNMREDIEILALRGNVDTRLNKFKAGQLDGFLVAAAAMHRLGLESEIIQYLPAEQFVPAAGQGALAVEGRVEDSRNMELAGRINDIATWKTVSAERAFLDELGGGCTAPIAAFARIKDGNLTITGIVADREGQTIIRDSLQVPPEKAEQAGILLAHKMLELGADKIIAKLRCG